MNSANIRHMADPHFINCIAYICKTLEFFINLTFTKTVETPSVSTLQWEEQQRNSFKPNLYTYTVYINMFIHLIELRPSLEIDNTKAGAKLLFFFRQEIPGF